jgi:hypothetical protein
MLKVDVDKIQYRSRFELQRIMYAMPRPFFVRLSSSRTGLHLHAPLCGEWDYRRYTYDDPMRVDLDTQRRLKRLPVSNLLWDVKNGKLAGNWHVMRNERDIEDYIDAVKPILI